MRRMTVILMLCVTTLMVPTLAAVRRVTQETAEIAQVTLVECQQIQIMIFFVLWSSRKHVREFVILPPCNSHLNFFFLNLYMVVHLERFCVFFFCFVLFFIAQV